MYIPKKNILAVYAFLFKEGVVTAKKDKFLPKHHTIEVPNLHVMKLMESLLSRGYVKETFSWQWLYYSLTDEGIEYLREYLHIPSNIEPATLKKVVRAPTARPSFRRFGDDERRGPRREGYRSGRGGRGGRGGFRGGFRGGRSGGRPAPTSQ